MTTPDPRCGQSRGYWAHRDRHEPACQPCKTAHAKAVQLTKMRRARGVPGFVDPAPARAHLNELLSANLSPTDVARAAAVAPETIAGLLGRRRGRPPTSRLKPHTARAILAVPVPSR